MDFQRSVDRKLFSFYLLGQSSFHPRLYQTVNLNWKHLILKFLPTAILMALNILLSTISLWYQYDFLQNNNSTLVLFVFTIAEVLTITSAVILSICRHKELSNLYKRFQRIESILKAQFLININFEFALKQHSQKVVVIVLTVVLSWVFKVLLHTARTDLWMQSGFLILLLLSLLTNFHVLFYIGLLRFFSSIFNENVHDDALTTSYDINYVDVRAIIGRLKVYKRIHFELGACVNSINEYFGWIFVSLLVLHFLHAIFSIYWIFVFYHEDSALKKLTFIRKFLLLLIYCSALSALPLTTKVGYSTGNLRSTVLLIQSPHFFIKPNTKRNQQSS